MSTQNGQFSFVLPLLPMAPKGNKRGIIATSVEGVVKTTVNSDSHGLWVEARPSFIDVGNSTKWFDEWVMKFIEGEFNTEAKLLRMQDKVHGYHLPPMDGNHPEWVPAEESIPLIDIQLKGDLPACDGWSLDGQSLTVEDYSMVDGPYKDLDIMELITHEPGKRRVVNQLRVTLSIESFFYKEYKDQQTLVLSVGVVAVDLITKRLLDFEGTTIQEYLDTCTEVIKPKGTGRKKTGLKLIQAHAKSQIPTEATPTQVAINPTNSVVDITDMI